MYREDDDLITIDVCLDIKVKTESNEIKPVTIKYFEIDVVGRQWTEDMHPDGIGYYETFTEIDDDDLNERLEDMVGKLDETNYNQELLVERIEEALNEKITEILEIKEI